MNSEFDQRNAPALRHFLQTALPPFTRRQFLSRFGGGFGVVSLAALGAMGLLPGIELKAADGSPLAPRQPHFKPKAKRVLQIFAAGAPSHVDTWDPKPKLKEMNGRQLPGDSAGMAFGSPFTFKKQGQSGIETSEVFPELARHIDKMAVVRSMYTEIPDHDLATIMMNTGDSQLVKPSVGSWVTYGLGSENQNMPGFIALGPGGVSAKNIRSAFLPGIFQGTGVDTQNVEVEKLIENIKSNYTSLVEQRRQLDLLNQLNEIHSQNLRKDQQLEARLQAFELAYQMQMQATDIMDIRKEPAAIRQAYAANTQQGRQMLMARRLLEKGVRFVQVWHGGWDHHGNLAVDLKNRAAEIDQPIAALLDDLERSGMLAETLVMWGGEFGRSPASDSNAMSASPGRNHNRDAFSIWLAGGGIKGGVIHGETDEFGARAINNRVGVHDLHATILHLMGFDHEKLTYRHDGRDYRLTNVSGSVVKGIIS